MSMTKGSDLFVAALENEGVDRIFGVPGEENLDVVESLRKSNIKLILTRHEQAAAFMAATHGRLTGTPGVCISTLGPGALELIDWRRVRSSRRHADDHDHGAEGDHDGEAGALSDCRRDRLHAATDEDDTSDRKLRFDPRNRARRFSGGNGRAARSCAFRAP